MKVDLDWLLGVRNIHLPTVQFAHSFHVEEDRLKRWHFARTLRRRLWQVNGAHSKAKSAISDHSAPYSSTDARVKAKIHHDQEELVKVLKVISISANICDADRCVFHTFLTIATSASSS